jgi:hypothetical protein
MLTSNEDGRIAENTGILYAKVLGLGDGAVDKLLATRVEAAVHDLEHARANHVNGASGPGAELPFAA